MVGALWSPQTCKLCGEVFDWLELWPTLQICNEPPCNYGRDSNAIVGNGLRAADHLLDFFSWLTKGPELRHTLTAHMHQGAEPALTQTNPSRN